MNSNNMNTDFKETDIITCKSYSPLCDYIYQLGDPVPEGLVHVNLEEIPEFFQEISNYPERKYVLVSSYSDYGVCEQKYSPPWKDIQKWACMMAHPGIGYNGIEIGARLDLEKCNPEDRYSIKCYAYTRATFNEIPTNVTKWFMTNMGIYDERVVSIPFGAAPDKEAILADRKKKQKKNLLYVNYQNTTWERVEYAKNFLVRTESGMKPLDWVNYSSAKPYEEYLDDLDESEFVLAPPGNGLDCYRVWESIYCGAVPVVADVPAMKVWENLDILLCNNFHIVMKGTLQSVQGRFGMSNEVAKLGYWKNRFNEEKDKIL